VEAITTIADDGVQVLARLLAGTPTSAVTLDNVDPEAASLARAVLAEDTDRLAAFDRAIAGRADADQLRRRVYAADPTAERPGVPSPVVIAPAAAGPEYPSLPAGLRPQVDIAGAGAWLDRYIGYASERSPMTPVLFHESAGLWLASVAAARRLMLPMPHGSVYPNLWMLWLAPTTIFHKSTGMAIAEGLALDLFPHLLLPGQTTPEALFGELAGREPFHADEMTEDDKALWERERDFAAQRSLLLDEASGMLNEAGRDYNAGLQEQLLKLYDCATVLKRQTQKQGRLTVHNAYLSLLAASTPSAMREHLRPGNLWTGGWWARCLLLTPEVAWQEYRTAPASVREPGDLRQGLSRLYRRLPQPTYPDPAGATYVTLGTGVESAWLAYHKAVGHDMLRHLDERLYGSYGRLPSHVLKVAMLLAALDWPEEHANPRIELAHLARAIDIAEGWRASLHRALSQSARTEHDDLRGRILDTLDVAGEVGATCRDLARQLSRKATEVQRLLNALVKEGEVEGVRQESGPKGGRPTDIFRRVSG